MREIYLSSNNLLNITNWFEFALLLLTYIKSKLIQIWEYYLRKYDHWGIHRKTDGKKIQRSRYLSSEACRFIHLSASSQIQNAKCVHNDRGFRISPSFPGPSFTGVFLQANPLSRRWTRTLSREKPRSRITLVSPAAPFTSLLPRQTLRKTRRDENG